MVTGKSIISEAGCNVLSERGCIVLSFVHEFTCLLKVLQIKLSEYIEQVIHIKKT